MRSLVPKREELRLAGQLVGGDAARGSSIIVPSRNGTVICRSRKTSSATCRTISACFRNSTTLAVSGTMTSGMTRPFRIATVQAASKIARTCMAVISG